MARGFNSQGTDYRGYQSSMDSADRQLTSAKDRAGKAAKQRRIDSETSDMAGIANIARVGAAIYTGGASEASGLGAMGSKALQGKKSDGSDYDDQMGDIIGTVAGGYNMMEGMKQQDISNLKAEDIAAYDRQIDFAKQFPEGSEGRQNALFAARDSLQGTRDTQKYGERADSNPFTYKKGRYKDGGVPAETDTNVIPDSIINGKDQADYRMEDRGPSGEELDKGVRGERVERQLNQQKALEEAKTSAREGAYGKNYKTDAAVDRQLSEAEKGMSVGKIDEDRMWKRLSNEDDIDREYNKKILDERGASFVGAGSDISNAEMEANVAGRNALIEAQNKKGSYSEPVYKTFSEKEAEKLSRKDTDKSTAMDDIAFGNKGKALEERGGFLRGFDKLLDPKQGKEDAQHLFEYKRNQEEALAREHARTGGPNAGEWRKRNNPVKSKLRKRIEARRQKAKEVALKRGGILAGSSAQ
jgi:hypothetical protein